MISEYIEMASSKKKTRTKGFRERDIDERDGEELGMKNDSGGAAGKLADASVSSQKENKRRTMDFVSGTMKMFLLSLVGVLTSWAIIQHGDKLSKGLELEIDPAPQAPGDNMSAILSSAESDSALGMVDRLSSQSWLVDSFPFHGARSCLHPFEHPLQPRWLAQYDGFFDLVGHLDAAVEVFSTDAVAPPVPPQDTQHRLQALYHMATEEGTSSNEGFFPVPFTAAEIGGILTDGSSLQQLLAAYGETSAAAKVQNSARLVTNLEAIVSLLELGEVTLGRMLEDSGSEPEASVKVEADITRRLQIFDAGTIGDINSVIMHSVGDNEEGGYRSGDSVVSGAHDQRVVPPPGADVAFAMERYSTWLQVNLGNILRSSQHRAMLHRWKRSIDGVRAGALPDFDQEQYENAMNVTNQVTALACDAYARFMHIAPFTQPSNKVTAVLVASTVLREGLGLPVLPLLEDPDDELLLGALGGLNYDALYNGFAAAVQASVADMLQAYTDFAFSNDGEWEGDGETDVSEYEHEDSQYESKEQVELV